MGRLRNRLWLITLGLFLFLFLGSLPAGADSLVRVHPSLLTPGVGSLLDVSVEVSSVVDLYAFQFDIRFDPAILSAVSVVEGSFLPGGGDTSFVPGAIDNNAGTISFTVGSLLDIVPGMSGSGSLAALRFQALAGGPSPIDLSGVVLLDSNLADIAFDTMGGAVNAVPESNVLLMLGLSLILLMGCREKFGGRNPSRP